MRAMRTPWQLGTGNFCVILTGITVLSLARCAGSLAQRVSAREAVVIDEAAKLGACRTNVI
jgi:hypothetical protein